MNKNEENVVKSILEANWLRPEVAVWRSMDALMLQKIHLAQPVCDLGCGDGIFSFLALGRGRIRSDYDAYFSLGESLNKTDIYNSKRRNKKPKLLKKPKLRITGLDHKQNLLGSAENLDFYERLVRHNLNKRLQLESDSFGTVFSNTLYWIDNVEYLIQECRRILKPDGRLVVFVPDSRFTANMLLSKFPRKWHWARALDNGMYDSRRHAKTFSDWKKLFIKGGFKMESHTAYMSDRFVKFHNIGTRTYSRYMIQAVNKLKPQERYKLKKQLVKDMFPVVKSYLKYESKTNRPKCFHMFSLRNPD